MGPTVRYPFRRYAPIRPDTRINRQIRVPEVRLIAADGEQVGVVSINDAIRKAEEAGLDLVEVAPDAVPPVCRIYDYKKALYEIKRKKKESRKKAHTVELKEIKLRISIDQHDLMTKLNNARKFFEKGDKVKFTVRLRGREVTKPEICQRLIAKVMSELADSADVENDVTRMGKDQIFILGPKKKSQQKKAEEAEARAAASPKPATTSSSKS